MPLSNVEENQVRELLTVKEELIDLGTDASAILSELGGSDITVPALDDATSLGQTDLFYIAQASEDKKATLEQLSDFILVPHLDDLDPHPQYLTQDEGDGRYARSAASFWLQRQLVTATGNFIVPAGISKVRAYAIGKGADGIAGTADSASGGGGSGGGCAWGDIDVTPGQIIACAISPTQTTFGAYLTATAGVGRTAPGTGTIGTGVTNSGTATGGLGGTGRTGGNYGGGGGGASGSPLGAGGNGGSAVGESSQGSGGGGWAGNGGNSSTNGGAGGSVGAGTFVFGQGTFPQILAKDVFSRYTDPLLAPCYSQEGFPSAEASAPILDLPNWPGIGGRAGGGTFSRGGYGAGGGGGGGGFGGGGGGGYNGGYGGGGGGGSASSTAPGPGGQGCIAVFW